MMQQYVHRTRSIIVTTVLCVWIYIQNQFDGTELGGIDTWEYALIEWVSQ